MKPGNASTFRPVELAESEGPALAALPDSQSTLHAFWHAAYLTLLERLPVPAVLEFFQNRGFTQGGQVFEGAKLFEHLFQPAGEIPMEWNYRGIQDLEAFLVGHGVQTQEFLQRLIRRHEIPSFLPASLLLSWFYPHMAEAYDSEDGRAMVLELLRVATERFWPGHRHRVVSQTQRGPWVTAWLAYITDPEWRQCRKTNFDWLVGEQIRQAPALLNLPTFERLTFHADSRQPAEILWEGACLPTEDGLLWDGLPLADAVPFHAFLAECGIDPDGLGCPNPTVYVAKRDVRCPRRNRIVLHRGCAYGAPFYLSRLYYRKLPARSGQLLLPLVRSLEKEHQPADPALAQIHAFLLKSLHRHLDFDFFPADESITCNGAYITKGIPAKILWAALNALKSDGRDHFTHREFKRDPNMGFPERHSNFEIRLYRLEKRLAVVVPQLQILRPERGVFRLKIDIPFRLESK